MNSRGHFHGCDKCYPGRIGVVFVFLAVCIVALSTEDIIPPVGEAETIAGPCRTLPKVDVRIMMTEKEVMCSLPAIDGKTDYASFM